MYNYSESRYRLQAQGSMVVEIEHSIGNELEEHVQPLLEQQVIHWAQAPDLIDLATKEKNDQLISALQDPLMHQRAIKLYAARLCFVNWNNRFTDKNSSPFYDYFAVLDELDATDPEWLETNTQLVSFIVEHTINPEPSSKRR